MKGEETKEGMRHTLFQFPKDLEQLAQKANVSVWLCVSDCSMKGLGSTYWNSKVPFLTRSNTMP